MSIHVVRRITYGYDLSGRRISQGGSLSKMLMPVTVAGAIYDSANRLTSWGGNALGYDNNGNLTADGASTFSWNARDELLSTSNGASAFAYDALGRRTSRTVAGAGMSYLHDGLNPVLVNNDQMLGGLGLDENYARISAGDATSFLSDGLGSTRLLLDASGASIAAYSYAPSGQAAHTGSDDTSFQFTGRENDGASGLYYYRARYYSPRLGRFIQSDPIGLAGGINTYAYVDNDPISYVDPTGLVKVDLFGDNDEVFKKRVAEYKDDPNMCLVYAHGNAKGVMNGKTGKLMGSKELTKALVDAGCKKEMPVVMYSCRTGEGKNSIAEKISKNFSSVKAPTKQIWYNRPRVWYNPFYRANGPDMIYGKNPDGTKNTNDPGEMRTFP